MVRFVVKNLAGEDVIEPADIQEPPGVAALRRQIAEHGRCPGGALFKLLQGTHVLQNHERVRCEDGAQQVMLTMVVLPPAVMSEEAKPLVLSEEADEKLSVPAKDFRTNEDGVLPVRYFLGKDGKAHIGTLAVEFAPFIGADVAAVARAASVDAVFEGEEVWKEGGRPGGRLWKVVGGGDRGGLLVRVGEELGSALLPNRLARGAVVEEEERAGDRLRYRRRAGRGPDFGWVSLQLKGRDLLVEASDSDWKEALMVPSGEAFRAVLRLEDMRGAFFLAAPEWKRQHSVIDLTQTISSRLDEVAMDLEPGSIMDDAVQKSRSFLGSLWNSG